MLTLAACNDGPSQPTRSDVELRASQPLALTGDALARCQALLDPDWLCESQLIRDQLCEAVARQLSLEIEIRGRFVTLRYRVTFLPQADGGVRVSLDLLKADGSIVSLGAFPISAERVQQFLASCPPPTDMTYRTTWTSATGVRVDREHRAQAGVPVAVDVDATAGADVTVDGDYAAGGIAMTLTRMPGISLNGLTLSAARDASAADDRLVSLTLESVPDNFAFSIDSDARRITGDASSPVDRAQLIVSAGSTHPGALNVEAQLESVLGSFELNFQSGLTISATDGIGTLSAIIRNTGLPALTLRPPQMGARMQTTAAEVSVGIHLRSIRALQVAQPFGVDLVGFENQSPLFFELTSPEASARAEVLGAPRVLSMRLSETTAADDPRVALSWATGPASALNVMLSGWASLGGGRLEAFISDLPSSLTLTLGVPTTAVSTARFQSSANAATTDVRLNAFNDAGAQTLALQLENLGTAARGCLAADGGCRSAAAPFDDYRAFDGHPAQAGDAAGLGRPYPAILSLDLFSEQPARLLSATLAGAGSPLVITDLTFRVMRLDAGMHPTSPTFSHTGTTLPRFYLFVDSDGRPFSADEVSVAGLLHYSTVQSEASDRRLWLPGTKCIVEMLGTCTERDLDVRASGTLACTAGTSVRLRAGNLDLDLRNLRGSSPRSVCES